MAASNDEHTSLLHFTQTRKVSSVPPSVSGIICSRLAGCHRRQIIHSIYGPAARGHQEVKPALLNLGDSKPQVRDSSVIAIGSISRRCVSSSARQSIRLHPRSRGHYPRHAVRLASHVARPRMRRLRSSVLDVPPRSYDMLGALPETSLAHARWPIADVAEGRVRARTRRSQ